MTAPELFLSALGACLGHYAPVYLNLRRLRRPAWKSGYAEPHREGLRRAVDQCLLHNTLLLPPNVGMTVVTRCKAEEIVPAAVTRP